MYYIVAGLDDNLQHQIVRNQDINFQVVGPLVGKAGRLHLGEVTALEDPRQLTIPALGLSIRREWTGQTVHCYVLNLSMFMGVACAAASPSNGSSQKLG